MQSLKDNYSLNLQKEISKLETEVKQEDIRFQNRILSLRKSLQHEKVRIRYNLLDKRIHVFFQDEAEKKLKQIQSRSSSTNNTVKVSNLSFMFVSNLLLSFFTPDRSCCSDSDENQHSKFFGLFS
jgi:hypothetical protein